jgi:DNA polymerase III sliding clamp (beta) subunit (PCNA family)
MKVKDIKKLLPDLNNYRCDVLPILENLNFTPGKIFTQGVSELMSFDFDHDIKASVNFSMFKRFVSALEPNDELTLAVNGLRIAFIINGKTEMTLLDELFENLPVIREPSIERGSFPIGRLDLSDIEKLKDALECIGTDRLRPAMCHISLGRKIASTDAHMMYFNTASDGFMTGVVDPKVSYKRDNNKIWEDQVDFNLLTQDERSPYVTKIEEKRSSFLISGKLARMVVNAKLETEVTVFFGHQKVACEATPGEFRVSGTEYVQFKNSLFTVIEQCCDETYPDFKPVIPNALERDNFVTVVNTKELLKAVKAASAVASKVTHQICFKFDQSAQVHEHLTVTSEDLDFDSEFSRTIAACTSVVHIEKRTRTVVMDNGDAQTEEVPAPKIYKEIAFNGLFLIRVLSKITTQTVEINTFAPSLCCIIDNKFLIMPVMLNKNY